MRIFFLILTITFLSTILKSQDVQLSLPIKHSSYINHIVFSKDRRYIYTSSADLSIKLWYFSSGNILKTFTGHASEIKDIAINNMNTVLFSADKAGNIFVWDVLTGKIKSKTKLQASVECILWHENKNELAVSTNDGKIIWYAFPEMTIKKTVSTAPYVAVKILKAKEPDLYYLGFKKCVCSSNSLLQRGNVQMYDMAANIFFPLCTYTDDLNNLILSPDSTKLVSTSAENYMVRVWDTGKLLEDASIKNPVKPYALFVSRTNKMIGVGSAENGELHIYRNSGEEILSTIIDTGFVVYGEINYDITRIHLLNNYGQFKKYDFDFNLKEAMGNYASVDDGLTDVVYSIDNKLIAMGLKKGKTKLLDLLNMQAYFIPDSFKTPVKQLSSSKDKVAVMYEPFFSYNETDGTTSFQSKLVVYDINRKAIQQSMIFKDKYVTAIYLNYNLLFLGFNNGKIEIWDISLNKKTDEFQASPYDILKIFYNESSRKIILNSIENQISVLYYKAIGKLELQKSITLNEQDEILSFYSNNICTKTKILFNSTEWKHVVVNSSFFNEKQIVYTTNDSICSINSKDSLLWAISNNFFNTKFILNDSILNKTILIDNNGNIGLLDSKNGNRLCDLYFDKYNMWVCKADDYYDIDERLLNKVYSIKGITFVESDLKKIKRIEGLLQKLLIDKSK